jgi:hypothetical protein
MTDAALTDDGLTDAGLPAFAADLGLPGIFDVHTHFMPDRMQAAVWSHFDALVDPSWPIHYRSGEEERLDLLPALRRHGDDCSFPARATLWRPASRA